MVHRSPARFLAPLALLACIGALFLIVTGPESGGSSGEREATPGRTTDGGGTTSTRTNESARPRGRRSYTIKRGDTASGIAETTGVPLDTLLELNPDVDPQALEPGTRLRLRR